MLRALAVVGKVLQYNLNRSHLVTSSHQMTKCEKEKLFWTSMFIGVFLFCEKRTDC